MVARHGGQLTLGYRLAVTSRVLAGTLGAYAVAALATTVVGPMLPLARNEAVTMATMLGVAVWVGAILWAFGARSAVRAWIGLGGAAAVLALCGWAALR